MDGRPKHLRNSTPEFRNLTSYLARSLLETLPLQTTVTPWTAMSPFRIKPYAAPPVGHVAKVG